MQPTTLSYLCQTVWCSFPFQNLGSLQRLRILSIQSNRITKLEGLESLTNLEELYISHNGLTKIEGLEKNVREASHKI